MTGALARGEINLHEAAQLVHFTPDRPECAPARAGALRAEVLRAHALDRGSENGLRARVKDIPGESDGVSGAEMASVVRKVDERLEVAPADKSHLFYEEMKRLFHAMREIEPEDLHDESLDRFMAASNQLSNAIRAIEMRRRRREKTAQKL